MRILRHPPFMFWFASLVVLSAVLVLARADGPRSPGGADRSAAESAAAALLRETTAYPSGSGPEQVRSWLEGVRDLAVAGAELAESSGTTADLSVWSDLLAAVSYSLESDISSREVAERASAVSFRVHAVNSHYRMR